MSTFSEDVLEKRLLSLKDTHDSISNLSAWCLEHPEQHKKIVSIWLQVLKKVKIEQRLTLFHLANDVIQYSKRKGFDFVESWGTALQKATTMVRDDKVKNKILRLFKIWDERAIYDEAFLVDLSGLLSSRKPAQSNQDPQDFQPLTLINKIRNCKTLEDDTDLKRKIVNESHLSLNDADALHSFLKDRRHGADLEQEIDEGVEKMMNYISALQAEIKDRAALIELLDHSDAFYENQRGEAKIVCNAYRNFSKRVENLKKKLDDLTSTLPSPVPSPDINAPSPSPESDIELPDESISDKYTTGASFIGSLVVSELNDKSKRVDEVFSMIRSPKDSPPSKMTYKPPTPPRNFKRKSSSPRVYHSPLTTYISSATPTLSSSSASNYSSNSPYQPVPKPNTTSYSIPSVTYPQNVGTSYEETTYTTPVEPYSNVYNPEDNNSMNSYTQTVPSPDGYHISGSNNPQPPANSYMNPPPPSAIFTALGRNQLDKMFPPSQDYPTTPAVPPPDYSVPPPPTNEYNQTIKPFYSSNNMTMPPLLGEDCPPSNINGLDSFLQSENSMNDDLTNAPPLLGSGFSSFMGNLNIPLDFQKGLFSENSCETPASPPPENILDDSTSQLDPFFSEQEVEGKPIEVINRTKQPDLNEILKAINMQGGVTGMLSGLKSGAPSPSIAIPPPPLPPPTLENTFPETVENKKSWSQPPMLPPKFPTWSQEDWTDTPMSPPIYEKSGFTEPAEFEDSDSLVLGDSDTDLRPLGLQGDIDHRNLISLTSSPREDPNTTWPPIHDTDYRKLVLVPKRATQDDNVESVDMEMSSDEEIEADSLKATSAISFSLTSHNKPLSESPLKEKDEPKTKKLLHINISPQKLMEPPPLPDMHDMLLEVENTVKSEGVKNCKIPTPPLPPLMPGNQELPVASTQPQTIQALEIGQEVPVITQSLFAHHRPRAGFNLRFNNPRQRFPQWQNNRPRQPPMTGPRFRPEGFRGRTPWYRGPPRPPRFTGCTHPSIVWD